MAAAAYENRKSTGPFCVFRQIIAFFAEHVMVTLYSYPRLYGVADNNGYGLKVYAFLRLAGVSFRQEHVFDASSAPRGQLPYIVDDENYRRQ